MTSFTESNSGFSAGTLVSTREGLKPIEDIRVGDFVLSYPDNQVPPDHKRQENEYTYCEVTKTLALEDQAILHVTVFDLAAGVKKTICVTNDHPIYVKNNGWVPASQLKFGSTLENSVFGNLLVTKVAQSTERALVFNLEIDNFATYYVGELGVWAHSSVEKRG